VAREEENTAVVSTESSAKSELKNRLVKNFSLVFIARLYYLATRFVLTPITLAYVSLSEYGIWSACFILISYMGMSSLGIANVYIRYVAEYHAKQEQQKINELVSTGLAVTTLLGVVLMAILTRYCPMVMQWLKVPQALSHTASVLVLATAGSFMLDLSFGVFTNVLTGLQRIAETNIVWVITVTLELAITVVLLHHGYGIYSLAWAFAIRYVVATIMTAVFCFRIMPTLSVSPKNIKLANLKLFFGYGSIVQISGLLSTFLYSVEKVLAGFFVGVQATALFDIGEKLPVMGSQLASSMNSIFMPALSYMNTRTWNQELIKFYLKGARYMNMISGTLLGFMAAFAGPLLLLWMGPASKFAPAVAILIIFCVPYQTHILTGPASAYHRGVGHPGREFVYPVLQLILVAVFVAIGFTLIGKTAIVIAWAVASAMVLSGIVYVAYTNHLLKVSQWEFWGKAYLPGGLPYLIAFFVRQLAKLPLSWAGATRMKLIVVVGGCSTLYLATITAVLYVFLCSWGEREYLRRQTLHTLGGLWGRSTA
jgi:O-antigen/teichoic acid export membrane protein